jgi:hypothetical protein
VEPALVEDRAADRSPDLCDIENGQSGAILIPDAATVVDLGHDHGIGADVELRRARERHPRLALDIRGTVDLRVQAVLRKDRAGDRMLDRSRVQRRRRRTTPSQRHRQGGDCDQPRQKTHRRFKFARPTSDRNECYRLSMECFVCT